MRVDVVRQVATAAGIGRTTMHKFVSSHTEPHPRTRRLLALYYIRMRGPVDEQRAADARTAFTILAGFYPPEARERIAAELLEVTERGFEREGMEVPGWIRLLRDGGTPRTIESSPAAFELSLLCVEESALIVPSWGPWLT